jgi:aspartate aminotransferase
MFESVAPRPNDAIMAVMEKCKADTRPEKIDLGVGVYKDATGNTTILKSVKLAEEMWGREETTKTYVGTVGNQDFCQDMLELMLGKDNPALTEGRLGAAQSAGGSGALRLGAELLNVVAPDATVWASTPTWANHIPLISDAGMRMGSYPYYNRETLGVDFEDMLTYLDGHAKRGDIVLLHGCCHNPTGADLSPAQWDRLAPFMAERGLFPYVDLAYFGLGRGMEEDTYGLRKMVEICPEVLLAASCSKNFALYRERTGLIAAITKDSEKAKIIKSQFGAIQRKLISMPPDHGAAIVTRILRDDNLRKIWVDELDEMRNRMLGLRQLLSEALNVQGGEAMAAAIKDQNGMFSTLPLSKEQVATLAEDHAVYLMPSGRINIAGANASNIPVLAKAILSVL